MKCDVIDYSMFEAAHDDINALLNFQLRRVLAIISGPKLTKPCTYFQPADSTALLVKMDILGVTCQSPRYHRIVT